MMVKEFVRRVFGRGRKATDRVALDERVTEQRTERVRSAVDDNVKVLEDLGANAEVLEEIRTLERRAARQ